jgi:DNA polymerase elongation subunit (family B)
MNIKNMTTDEIEHFDWSVLSDSERKDVIKQLKDESLVFKTKEQANKLVLNSMYGAMANKYFYFYNKDLAETITIQGQDAIKFAEKSIDLYFHTIFHKDKEVLSALQEICPNINMNPVPCKKPMTVYMDTDSLYITYEEVAENINWTGSSTDLVLTIDKVRISNYIKKVFDKYADSYNTDNYLVFDLETISKTGIWVKKKKYTQDIVWEDGKFYESGDYIKTVGLEIIRLTTPPFCRPELVNLVKWIFENGKTFTQKDITMELLKIKKRFAIADIEEISITTGIGDYEKYVLNDTTTLSVDGGCGTHVRGAAIYNLYLNLNPTYKNQYSSIKTGDKVKWYYAKSHKPELNVFSYKRGEFPKEFAPDVDIDLMFEKTIINPLNNIVQAIPGITALTGSLKIKNKLF